MNIRLGAGMLTVSEAAAMLGGEVIGRGNATIEGICTDSREACAGMLFVALPGERTDGHNYIATAVSTGCNCFLVSRREAVPDGVGAILVGNTEAALMRLAAAYSERVECRRIGVTGSVGKTTTKEYISAVLAQKYRVHKTRGNFNSTIGMPLSVMETPADTQLSVLEMAMSGFGEICAMSKCAHPEIAVITTIGSSHMEALGSRENIRRAKLEILEGLHDGGTLVLNGDDDMLSGVCFERGRTVTVGIDDPHADYLAVGLSFKNNCGYFDIRCPHGFISDIKIPAVGKHNVYAALFAAAVGDLCGVNSHGIRAGLWSYAGMGLRQNIYRLDDITVIEDCYNASPESMRAALEVLEMLRAPGGRTVAVLGDMRELGVNSVAFHREIGRETVKRGVDLLFTLGGLAKYIASEALECGMEEQSVFVNLDENTYAATAWELYRELRPGDVLLVKASRAIRAERVIQSLREIYRGV
ncbi:MAG: UDP-N-acetylmuramoyl-tripeptide--D-alanyl-D-alanine ligase [Eubacteriales bacterium]|nr:UDP-N-acetylmuramoyl-tripeptide--D-alanyl-D-alanine ligase [Eubacteriales bacterium]MDY4898511.1 UDP-N-acetylmuramoyl-tripeptide--D-alanyl-D-alanine ligase [Eubacteriales bacterium]